MFISHISFIHWTKTTNVNDTDCISNVFGKHKIFRNLSKMSRQLPAARDKLDLLFSKGVLKVPRSSAVVEHEQNTGHSNFPLIFQIVKFVYPQRYSNIRIKNPDTSYIPSLQCRDPIAIYTIYMLDCQERFAYGLVGKLSYQFPHSIS